MSTVTVRLLKPLVQGGVHHVTGAEVTLREDQAERLARAGVVAEPEDRNKPAGARAGGKGK